ncbi:MAG: cysteine hydrolase family protein, partial [Methylocella sp.]
MVHFLLCCIQHRIHKTIFVSACREVIRRDFFSVRVSTRVSIELDKYDEALMTIRSIQAEPQAIPIDPKKTALLIIDMQRDFLEGHGFGASLGNDVSLLQRAVGPCKDLLNLARQEGLLVMHTREGHRPDLNDVPLAKLNR